LRPQGINPQSTERVATFGFELRDDGISSRPLHILRECPKTYISNFSRDVIGLYTQSVQFNNALPDAGGINDQNAVVMEALSIVREEVFRVEQWRRYQEKLKRDRKTPPRERARQRR